MKIVHIMNWYIPKTGYQENYLPLEQKKLGHDVEIVTSDRLPAFSGFERHIGKIHTNRIIGSGIFDDQGVTIYRLPPFIEIKNGGQILLLGLKKKLKELKPDIIHLHGAFTFLTLQIIYFNRNSNFNIVVDDHCHNNNFILDSFFKKIYIKSVKLFYNTYGGKVSFFMPVTFSSKSILESFLNIPDQKIELLHLGADTNFFKPSEKLREKGRRELGIGTNDILIITSGKFTKSKDIHILIKSFIDISRKFPNIKLLILGSGPEDYMNHLKKVIDCAKIKNRVIFHDFVPNFELPKYYNAADIGVWPGDHTITAVEAASGGLPVIVPSSDLAYKVLFQMGAAIGYERGNEIDLAKKLGLLIQDKKMMDEIRVHALNAATTVLSWKVIARKSIEIYENAIN